MRRMSFFLSALLAGIAALAGVAAPAQAAGIYRVMMTYHGATYCLDAEIAGGGNNGNRVRVMRCTGADNQRWQLVGDARLQNVWALKHRNYPHAGYLHRSFDVGGIPVTLHDITAQNQFWRNLRPGAPTPHFILSSDNDGLCLDADASGGGVVNGRKVQLYGCISGAENQEWHLAVAG